MPSKDVFWPRLRLIGLKRVFLDQGTSIVFLRQ